MKNYSGKVAFITGGGSGIGFGLACALGRRGAKVALASTDATKLSRAVDELRSNGVSAHAVTLDVTKSNQWPDALASAEKTLGPISFLGLNAGIAPEPLPLEATPPEQWEWSLAVNLLGAVNGIRAALPTMRASGREGHVLFTSSIGCVKLSPMTGSYVVAKAGLMALAEVLRGELQGSAVGASVFMPGPTKTDLATSSATRSPTSASKEKYGMINAMLSGGSEPSVVAEFVLDQISAGSFYIFPHTNDASQVRGRLAEISNAFDFGMES